MVFILFERMQNQNVGVRLGRLIVPVIVFSMYLVYSGVYSVPEGHVGMIYQYGALTPGAKPPGVHLRFPFVTTVSVVDLRLQTDVVTEIPCGTKGGVMIYFDKYVFLSSFFFFSSLLFYLINFFFVFF